MDTHKLKHIRSLPSCPKGYSFVCSNVSLHDELLLLYVEDKASSQVHGYSGETGQAQFPVSKMSEQYRYKLCVLSKTNDDFIDLPPTELAFPSVEIFSDKSVVLIGCRCEIRSPDNIDKNGLIFNQKTGESTQFLAGDGISHVGVDGDDYLWIGYFDEGVYGNYGWGGIDELAPIGCWGLNKFSRQGQIVWRHEHSKENTIDDCYALNVTKSGVYFFYYSDFCLGEVYPDGSTKYFKTDIAGSHSFAIDDNIAVFGRQYREEFGRLNFVKISGEQCFNIGEGELVLPNGDPISEGELISRGEIFHYIYNDQWYQWRVAKV